MDDENTQDPKPMVTFAFLPKEDSDNQKPDILDKIIHDYQKKKEIPFQFGATKTLINDEIKRQINEYHKIKEQPENEEINEEEDLVGPPIPKNYN